MSFRTSATSFVPAATIALMAVFSSIDHADKVLRIQCAFRAFQARNTLQYLKQLAAYTESINTPEHHAAVRKIQKAFKLAIPKARVHHSHICSNHWDFPDSDTESGSIDLTGNIVTIIEGRVLGRFEEDQFVPGCYVFGRFHPFAKEILTEDECTDAVEEQMNAEVFKYTMETEDLLKGEEYSPRLWELINLLYTMDSADAVAELCERYGFNPCNYSNKCGNRSCKDDHPFGTDLLKNSEAYRASKASKKVPSSSESVSSDITDDEITGASTSLSVSSPACSPCNRLAQAKDDARALLTNKTVIDFIQEDDEVITMEDLVLIAGHAENFGKLYVLLKPKSQVLFDNLRTELLAEASKPAPAPVETKTPAPQQIGGGAIQSTYCRNWQKTGTCSFGDRCHNKAFHITKVAKATTPCHNKAFKSGKDCDWANCILCHDRPSTPQAHVQVQAPSQPPAQKPKGRR